MRKSKGCSSDWRTIRAPNERDEIERLLAKIETALTWLESNDPVEEDGPL